MRIVDKYISLCPVVGPKTKQKNFYLRSLDKINPAQWYGEAVVGVNSLTVVVKELLKSVSSDKFYSNHSLRRSGTTHLFIAGIDRKLVKEFTGHTSDAVDSYQITSDEQRAMLSNVIQGPKQQSNGQSDGNVHKNDTHKIEVELSQKLV